MTMRPWRIIGIDNGTSRLGISNLEYDIDTEVLLVKELHTFIPKEKGYLAYPLLVERFGKPAARSQWMVDNVREYITENVPDVVCIETPFIGGADTLSSFAPLKQLLTMLTQCIYEVSDELGVSIFIQYVSPYEAKGAVNHSGKFSSSKGDVPINILSHPKIDLNGHDLERAGPDAVDSIAIGYFVTTLLSQLPPVIK